MLDPTLSQPTTPRKINALWQRHAIAWTRIAAEHSNPAVRQWAAQRAAYCRRKAAQS